MKYLKVYADFVADMEELVDAERGRLFTAMLDYARTGEPPTLRGNERILWGTAKKMIDGQRTAYEKQCAANKQVATNRYESLRQRTTTYESCQEQEQEQEYKETYPKGYAKKANAFQPPTVDEVAAYCRERGNSIDAAYFVDYYAAQKWYRSKGVKMSDWKAAVRTWERNEHGRRQPRRNDKYGSEAYEQHTVTMAQLQDAVIDLTDMGG